MENTNTAKRIRRTPEQLVQEIEEKLEKTEQALEELEGKRRKTMRQFDEKSAGLREKRRKLMQKRESLLAPKPPRKTKKEKLQRILSEAQRSGMTVQEIAQRLGVDWEE